MSSSWESEFVRVGKGRHVNRQHIRTLRARPEGLHNQHGERYDCLDARGESLGSTDMHDIVAHPPWTTVPDTRGTTLVQFFLEKDGTVVTARMPVLAWAVTWCDAAEPICCEFLRAGPGEWCLEMPVGTGMVYIFPEDSDHTTFESALAYVTKQLLKNEKRREEQDKRDGVAPQTTEHQREEM